MNELLTTEQAAKLKRVTPPTIRNWIARHGLRTVRVGHAHLLRREDVEAFERPLAGRPGRKGDGDGKKA